jgi:hypothetical protein
MSVYAGLDVSLEETAVCIVDAENIGYLSTEGVAILVH